MSSSSFFNRRILVIDDNEGIHQDFQKILTPGVSDPAANSPLVRNGTHHALTSDGFEVDSALQGAEGFDKILAAHDSGRPYAMAFVKVRMPPGWDGIETIGHIWERFPDMQIVLCTAHTEFSLGQVMARLPRTDKLLILRKPFDASEVIQVAHVLTEKWRLKRAAADGSDLLVGAGLWPAAELREANHALELEIDHHIGHHVRFLERAVAEVLAAITARRPALGLLPVGGAADLLDPSRAEDLELVLREIPMTIRECARGVERVSKIVEGMTELLRGKR